MSTSVEARPSGDTELTPAEPAPSLVDRARQGLERLGALVMMTGKVFSRAVRPPYDWGALVYHTESLGVRSIPNALLTSSFAGLVISLQFGFFLARFGVQYTVGRVVILTLFRELAPVLMALTVGTRIASGIAAELGSMVVTEQVDAIRALGADPLRKLVVPRVFACLLVMPTLTVLADVVGLMAGAFIVNLQFGITFDLFFQGALDSILMIDFTSGAFKGAVFGVSIALVGCFKGLTAEGGTEGVGRATTQSVAITSITIILADFFITKLTLYL